MCDYMGQIVRATAGRDKEGLFCVVGADHQKHRLLLADGKRRRLARPKQKQPGHVHLMSQVLFDHSAIQKLKRGEPVTDRELRRALAAFKEENTLG